MCKVLLVSQLSKQTVGTGGGWVVQSVQISRQRDKTGGASRTAIIFVHRFYVHILDLLIVGLTNSKTIVMLVLRGRWLD